VLAEGDKLTRGDLPEEVFSTGIVGSSSRSSPQSNEDSLSSQLEKEGGIVAPVNLADSISETLHVPFTANFREDRREFERRYITRCLDEADGNVTRAAAVLGMHRQSLQHKLRELGLGRRYVSVEESE
jgi:DNA-binding NtrC family response regulator